MKEMTQRSLASLLCCALVAGIPMLPSPARGQSKSALTAAPVSRRSAGFQIEEATIDDVHAAIRQGRTTCRDVVQAYVQRARAYNGVCTQLVMRDGASLAGVGRGTVRAGQSLAWPTATTAVSAVLPDFERYAGLPIDFGRLETTSSDPSVQQQYGMVIGVPNAGQVNALSTLNIRGERSVTCKGAFDQAPFAGPLPP